MDGCQFEEERRQVLGDPLTEEEVGQLVEKYRHSDCARQINLGNFLLISFLFESFFSTIKNETFSCSFILMFLYGFS